MTFELYNPKDMTEFGKYLSHCTIDKSFKKIILNCTDKSYFKKFIQNGLCLDLEILFIFRP